MTQNGNSENKLLTLAYDLFAFEDYGMVKPLRISVEPQYNSHMVIAGSSGTGKSYALLQLLARSIQIQPNGIFLFGDSAGFWRLFSAGLIVIGVIGLKIAH